MVAAKEVSVKEVVREMVVVVEKKVWAKEVMVKVAEEMAMAGEESEEEMVKAEVMAKAEGMVKVEEDVVTVKGDVAEVIRATEVSQVEDVAEETEEE